MRKIYVFLLDLLKTVLWIFSPDPDSIFQAVLDPDLDPNL
jgi:hypothetical protein